MRSAFQQVRHFSRFQLAGLCHNVLQDVCIVTSSSTRANTLIRKNPPCHWVSLRCWILICFSVSLKFVLLQVSSRHQPTMFITRRPTTRTWIWSSKGDNTPKRSSDPPSSLSPCLKVHDPACLAAKPVWERTKAHPSSVPCTNSSWPPMVAHVRRWNTHRLHPTCWPGHLRCECFPPGLPCAPPWKGTVGRRLGIRSLQRWGFIRTSVVPEQNGPSHRVPQSSSKFCSTKISLGNCCLCYFQYALCTPRGSSEVRLSRLIVVPLCKGVPPAYNVMPHQLSLCCSCSDDTRQVNPKLGLWGVTTSGAKFWALMCFGMLLELRIEGRDVALHIYQVAAWQMVTATMSAATASSWSRIPWTAACVATTRSVQLWRTFVSAQNHGCTRGRHPAGSVAPTPPRWAQTRPPWPAASAGHRVCAQLFADETPCSWPLPPRRGGLCSCPLGGRVAPFAEATTPTVSTSSCPADHRAGTCREFDCDIGGPVILPQGHLGPPARGCQLGLAGERWRPASQVSPSFARRVSASEELVALLRCRGTAKLTKPLCMAEAALECGAVKQRRLETHRIACECFGQKLARIWCHHGLDAREQKRNERSGNGKDKDCVPDGVSSGVGGRRRQSNRNNIHHKACVLPQQSRTSNGRIVWDMVLSASSALP